MLAFNPHDGYLYIGSGSDGNSNCDPQNNAQNKQSNLGKILRLQVDSLPYSTAGNPWHGSPSGNDEIWAYGLKNPWRFAIDPVTGVILIGDVGERTWEEIDCQPAGSTGGENYGYKNFEALACPAPAPCPGTAPCLLPGHVPPIRFYGRDGGNCSVISGYVYRGCRMSDLHGTYFYGDYCSSFIKTFRFNESCTIASGPTDLDRTADLTQGTGEFLITSFGQDARGEMHVIYKTGQVFKIVPTLGIMEVSARNAAPLRMGSDGSWSWEDLEETAGHSISSHKVYRADDDPTDTFVCVFEGADSVWSGGDPETPTAGEVFYYLATSLNATGEETRAGTDTDGNPRDVNFGSTCP